MIAEQLGWQFASPQWWWLLPLALLWLRGPRRAALPMDPPYAPGQPVAWPHAGRARWCWMPACGDALAVVLGIAALAAPIRVTPAPPTPPGRDLLLCLDVSSSMAVDDLQPGRTRLAVGLQQAGEFVASRPHDRLGLVVFARYADLRCPPTHDHVALLERLAAVAMVAKDGPEDATAIGAAVLAGAASLRRSVAKARVLVLVTDGEENVATTETPDEIAPLHAAQFCREAGIRVHTVVVGRGSQRPDGTFAPLDTTAVRQLADVTGGRAFTAGDAAQLADVYRAIDALEPVPLQARGVRVEAWFPVALLLAVLVWAFAHGLAHGPLRRLP